MHISAIQNYNQNIKFSGGRNGYENPINRQKERNLAILSSFGVSSLVGTAAAGIGSCFIEAGSSKRALKLSGIGILAGLAVLGLTLPAKLYDTKVKAFAREKEMDVFSRDRDLKSNIMEEVDKEVKDEDVDLDQKINHYTSVQMANNGNGMLIKGA